MFIFNPVYIILNLNIYSFFYIIAISIDAFLQVYWWFSYAHVIPVHRHAVEEALNRIFHLVAVVEVHSGQMFFQLRKQVEVTGCQVRI